MSEQVEHEVTSYIEALKRLTPREIEVLERVGQGYTSKEAAKLLSISPNTVSKHRENIRKKLDLSGSIKKMVSKERDKVIFTYVQFA